MPDKHEKVIEKQLSLYNYMFEKYERYFVSSKTKDTYLTLANYNKWSVRIASHVLNNKSSNKSKEKVCKKVFDKLIKKKNPVFNFDKQAIYVEKYTMENVSYEIAIYAHQGGLTLDYSKISLKSMSDLANSTYIKAGYTQNYGLLVFYNEKQQPIMTIQIATDGDPKQSTIKWLNYLGIVTKTDIQEENDKPIFDKMKENLLTITQLMLLWNNENLSQKDETIKLELFMDIFNNGKNEKFIETSFPFFYKYMKHFNIDTDLRIAHFLSQVGKECGYFSGYDGLKENLKYNSCNIRHNLCQRCYKLGSTDKPKCPSLKGDCLAKYGTSKYNLKRTDMCEHPDKYAFKDEEIAMAAYNGFIGRGFIHLTHEDNYRKVFNYLVEKGCAPKNFLNNPSILSNDIETAVMSACAFFEMNGANTAADNDDFDHIMRIVNARDTNRNEKFKLLNKVKLIINNK